MITRGSRFFFAAAAIGYFTALLYGFITGASDHGGAIAVFNDGAVVDSVIGPLTFGWKGWVGEHVGYTVLMAFAAAMAMLGGFTTAARDADAESLAQLEGIEAAQLPPAAVPAGLSWWPLLAALGTGVVIVGLVFSNVLLWGGVAILVAAAVEWTVKAWSERATEDAAANAEYRSRMLQPAEVPIASALVIGLVAVAISRVLLAVPKSAAVYIIILLAAVIFGVANLLASRPELKTRVLGAVVFVSLLVIIAAGIAGGISGTRDIEEHHGEGALAASSADGSHEMLTHENNPAVPGRGI
jgi:hypothetical protein